jgi:ribose-phosphate pyrophosphokinase
MNNNRQIDTDNLRLIVFDSAKELGEKVNEKLLKQYRLDPEKYTFIVPINQLFFEDGHLKVEIKETVRGKDIFMLTDIGNYSLEYKMHGLINHTSPNDLVTQLKDGIGACNCHAKSINVIMPLLYCGRQHRRNTREHLSCGAMLYDLDRIHTVKSFITFDAHDEGVEHAIHNTEFDNVFPTNVILEDLINDLPVDRLKNMVFVAPDNGATGRRNVYLNSFGTEYVHKEAGSLVKKRDYNTLIDGKYPVIAHEYCGYDNLEGYTAIITDDMISSGQSILDVAEELKKHGVEHSYVVVTYALFTKGIDKFQKAVDEGKIDGIYTTNLSYIPEEYKKKEWIHICDCSDLMADLIYNIHNDLSISKLLHDKSLPIKLIKDKFEREKRKEEESQQEVQEQQEVVKQKTLSRKMGTRKKK